MLTFEEAFYDGQLVLESAAVKTGLVMEPSRRA
jgi:hypothetical protein